VTTLFCEKKRENREIQRKYKEKEKNQKGNAMKTGPSQKTGHPIKGRRERFSST
jgi:hypothetical protein